MNLAAVMKELASVVGERTDLGSQSYWFAAKRITPPAFLMMLPEEINPMATYARGMSEYTLDGYLIASLADAEGAVETVSKYSNGSGDNSIIEAAQSARYKTCDVVTVERIRYEPVTLFAVIYLAARFTFAVKGSGR
jgi:hypothetical protein